MGIYSLYR
ncbi:hypothetical protein ID866_6012 [Astraeus odoratus]|nr:hypothetical protein ID866_6012 [Astraeus odoratus]